MIPDEGQFEGREDERLYYESYAFAYEELLRAMFPNDLGFHVDRQIMPTGAGVFHCRIQNIPMFFGEIKPGRHANRTQDRYDADCEVRERLLDLVGYLRRNFEQKTRPDRVYAVSALGLQVRFYYADVGGDVGDPITIQPPPRPPYSQATCSGKDQYDYWRLSILDTLPVNTLKTICENVHKFAERVRSATVPHSDEAAAVEVFHGKYLMVRDFERLGLPVPEVGGCYGRVDLYTLIEDMETYRDAPPATKTAKRDKEYDDGEYHRFACNLDSAATLHRSQQRPRSHQGMAMAAQTSEGLLEQQSHPEGGGEPSTMLVRHGCLSYIVLRKCPQWMNYSLRSRTTPI